MNHFVLVGETQDKEEITCVTSTMNNYDVAIDAMQHHKLKVLFVKRGIDESDLPNVIQRTKDMFQKDTNN